jgi:hypothetical protein
MIAASGVPSSIPGGVEFFSPTIIKVGYLLSCPHEAVCTRIKFQVPKTGCPPKIDVDKHIVMKLLDSVTSLKIIIIITDKRDSS